jgi:hypothetical protein
MIHRLLKRVRKALRLMSLTMLIVLGIPMMVADQNVFFDSRVSIFTLATVDLSIYVKELRGLPGQVKMNDVTTFGSLGERPGPSIFVNHFTVEFLFNMVTSTGVWTTLNGIYTNKTLSAFVFEPAGAGSAGNAKITGSAYLAVCEITSRVGDYVTVHTEFHCDNGVTIGVTP